MNLLTKTRKINSMLQASAGKPVNFKEMAATLSEVIESNVFHRKLEKESYWDLQVHQQIENERMIKMMEERQFPEKYTKNLISYR